jgi:dienelactone hydrolase
MQGRRLASWIIVLAASLAAAHPCVAEPSEPLPGTRPLEMTGDITMDMVAAIDKFLLSEIERSVETRDKHWRRDYSSPEAYAASIEPNRERFKQRIGVVDARLPVAGLQFVSSSKTSTLQGMIGGIRAYAVIWPVLPGVFAEGLLLEPEGLALARVVVLPDADQTPEMLAGLEQPKPGSSPLALQLAQAGCQVLVPVVISRDDRFSGNPAVRMTNEPQREYLWRPAFEMGRHIIGYEVQKVLAAVDHFRHANKHAERNLPIGVAGYGEGGLVALYAAACDRRIEATLVSGYFQEREQVWNEPVYRHVWGLLEEFGDAEIAGLVAPRTLVIEACRGPEVAGPPKERPGANQAAPGALVSPPLESVRKEFQRAQAIVAPLGKSSKLQLVVSDEGQGPAGAASARQALLDGLEVAPTVDPAASDTQLDFGNPSPEEKQRQVDRMGRQVEQLDAFTQRLMRDSEVRRAEFWAKADRALPERWHESCNSYREYLWEEVLGRFPSASAPPNVRSRLAYDQPKWRGYEVVMDIWPGVFAYGVLLLPKDLQPGERRPVVVCQHGRNGRPQDVVNPTEDTKYYHSFGAQLADRGFIVYAPQNAYIGEEKYRQLQRKAYPLKKTFYSVIAVQHARTLQWLQDLPMVDPERVAFYGLSYGGETAMRIPAILEGYCLSICSANFNQQVWKHASTSARYSYVFSNEYEQSEFDSGNTFSDAEMAGLIAPRPFMVERGHQDAVAPDEWVAYEYAKVQRLYDDLKISDRTEMEVFSGGHEIHSARTFDFLHKHLNWPKR